MGIFVWKRNEIRGGSIIVSPPSASQSQFKGKKRESNQLWKVTLFKMFYQSALKLHFLSLLRQIGKLNFMKKLFTIIQILYHEKHREDSTLLR